MSKRSRYSVEEKLHIVEQYFVKGMTGAEMKNIYGVMQNTVAHWKYLYEKYGSLGLKESTTCKKYSPEVKLNAVTDYLSGDYSQTDIVKKHKISSRSVLDRWIKKYNSHSELKNSTMRMVKTMTKGRSTTWKERIEIATYCMAYNKDYQLTADKYNVSYQQVYQWVQKYERDGENGLQDRRGKKKSIEVLTSEEKYELELKKMKAENERLKAENALLKKLEKLERR